MGEIPHYWLVKCRATQEYFQQTPEYWYHMPFLNYPIEEPKDGKSERTVGSGILEALRRV